MKRRKLKTIDLTPTWEQQALMSIAILEDGDAEGKQVAREEIRRMGTLLDGLIAERGHSGPVKVKQS